MKVPVLWICAIIISNRWLNSCELIRRNPWNPHTSSRNSSTKCIIPRSVLRDCSHCLAQNRRWCRKRRRQRLLVIVTHAAAAARNNKLSSISSSIWKPFKSRVNEIKLWSCTKVRGGRSWIDRYYAATVGATGCSDGCADNCSFCDRRNRLLRRSLRVALASSWNV